MKTQKPKVTKALKVKATTPGIKKFDLIPPLRKPAPSVTDLMHRENRKVEKLTKLQEKTRRQIARARLRYSTYKAMANGQVSR